MAVEIISWSIVTKIWDRAGIEFATPGSAVKHVTIRNLEHSVCRHSIETFGNLQIMEVLNFNKSKWRSDRKADTSTRQGEKKD